MPSRVQKKGEANSEQSQLSERDSTFSSFYAPSLSIFALKLQAKLIRLQLLCWLTSETTYALK